MFIKERIEYASNQFLKSNYAKYFIKVCLWFLPFILGAIISDKIIYIYSQNLLFQPYECYKVIVDRYTFTLTLLYIIMLIAGAFINDWEYNIVLLTNLLKWVYREMEFGKKHGAVRLTLWVPTKREGDGTPIELEQITNYHPPKQPKNSSNEWFIFGTSGRKFTVSIKNGATEKPKGVLGACAIECMNDLEPIIAREKITLEEAPDTKLLEKCLMEKFHFTQSDIDSMTPNRRAFLCMAILNKQKEKLLCILFADSENENTFDDTTVNKLQSFLPLFAILLTKDQN